MVFRNPPGQIFRPAPFFRGAYASRSTNQAITTATWTAIQCDVADVFDTDAFHDTVTNNTRFTIPTGLDGVYVIVGQAAFDVGSFNRYIALRTAGANLFNVVSGLGPIDVGSTVRLVTSLILNLAAGDYIELVVQHNKGSDMNISAATFSLGYLGRL